MRFTLTIELGNDAMQTDLDIAQALRDVAALLSDSDDSPSNQTLVTIPVFDVNGNRVGQWSVTE